MAHRPDDFADQVSAENQLAPGTRSPQAQAQTANISSSTLTQSAPTLNGLRNPMERKDLSIKSTEEIPMRSTIHQKTSMFRLFLPPRQSRKTVPLGAQDQFLETAPKRSRGKWSAVADSKRKLLCRQPFRTRSFPLRGNSKEVCK